MRLLSAFILSLIVLANTIADGVVFMSFKVDQDRIAATECENRDRPELACKGKCVLMQKLEKQSKEEEKEFPKSETSSLVLYAEVVEEKAFQEIAQPVQRATFKHIIYSNPYLDLGTDPPELTLS